MSAHTPGPWYIRTHDYANVRGADGIFHDGSNLPIVNDVWGKTLAQADANARLIAAAPDLLAALAQLLAEVDDMTKRAGWAGNGGRDMARAAISRALGDDVAKAGV